jgi:hypothetical protein
MVIHIYLTNLSKSLLITDLIYIWMGRSYQHLILLKELLNIFIINAISVRLLLMA